MKLRFVSVVSIVLAATLLIAHANAGPVAVDSLDHLIASADLIVLGPFVASKVNGVMSFAIQASRVIKGTISTNSSIALTWSKDARSAPAYATPPILEKGFGIFFLSSGPRGCSIIPVMIGDVEWLDTFVHASAVRDAQSEVVNGSRSNVFGSVLGELVRLVKDGQQIPYDLVDLYRLNRDPVLANAFNSFRADQDINLVAIGVQGGLAVGDLPTLTYLRENAQTISKAARWKSILDEIKIYYSNVSTVSVQNLGEIAIDAARDIPQREAAAAALARIHSMVCLPYLSKLLQSHDNFMQAMAVGGIAAFANNVPVNSHEPASGAWPYRTDETIAHSAFDESLIQSRPGYYVGFWQTWVQQNASLINR